MTIKNFDLGDGYKYRVGDDGSERVFVAFTKNGAQVGYVGKLNIRMGEKDQKRLVYGMPLECRRKVQQIVLQISALKPTDIEATPEISPKEVGGNNRSKGKLPKRNRDVAGVRMRFR